jgi:hypothetical protein
MGIIFNNICLNIGREYLAVNYPNNMRNYLVDVGCGCVVSTESVRLCKEDSTVPAIAVLSVIPKRLQKLSPDFEFQLRLATGPTEHCAVSV